MKPSKSLPDDQLLQLATCGSKQAFGFLYERYLENIYRFVLIKIGNSNIAEDLTEETFIRTWEYLPSLARKNGRINNFKAFLYRTASNLVIDFYRKKHACTDNLDQIIQIDESPEKISEKHEQERKIMRCLRQLKPGDQKILILRYVNQLSHQETASIMDISEAHSRVLQYRALKKLQALMKEEG